MLVLTRRIDESVVVGDPDGLDGTVKVTVLSAGHGKVRLGFEVAGDVPVHRSEVWQRIRAKALASETAHRAAVPVV